MTGSMMLGVVIELSEQLNESGKFEMLRVFEDVSQSEATKFADTLFEQSKLELRSKIQRDLMPYEEDEMRLAFDEEVQ